MKALAVGILILGCSATFLAIDANYPSLVAAQATGTATERIPTQADIDSCNAYARDQSKTGTGEVLKDTAIGGLGGAGVGAAGGAIAGGGSGAGKGAAIGGIVGAVAGTLYGLNEKEKNAPNYESSYRSCMAQHGY
jgi:hypothetical protein